MVCTQYNAHNLNIVVCMVNIATSMKIFKYYIL